MAGINEHIASLGPRGDWMTTYTGRVFHPIDPKVEDVCIEDIAHGLALQCRYAGQCRAFYSVAQHCVMGSYIVSKDWQLEFLLHDAQEAYIQDMIRPLKNSALGEVYLSIENPVAAVIAQKFQLKVPFDPCIKRADNIMLFTEKRDLITYKGGWGGESDFKPLDIKIEPWSWRESEQKFIERFGELYAKR
jgi:hypothetical protein